MTEQPIPLETYRMLLEDEFELEEIKRKRPDAEILLELADRLDKLGSEYLALVNETSQILREVVRLGEIA